MPNAPDSAPVRAPGGNDPILQCDPMGFPRVMFLNTPFEFVQLAGRVIQFFEHEHEYRTIWTDGRPLPTDADPTWYGYATGHWESDETFVVESTGFRDSTWLGSTGYPHSENMRVIELYHRADHDTIDYDTTIIDPMAYTRPIIGPHRIMKLRPKDELIGGDLRAVGRKILCQTGCRARNIKILKIIVCARMPQPTTSICARSFLRDALPQSGRCNLLPILGSQKSIRLIGWKTGAKTHL